MKNIIHFTTSIICISLLLTSACYNSDDASNRALSDLEAVTVDTQSLEIIFNNSDSSDSITGNIILPVICNNGSTVTWESDKDYVIDSKGRVSRPPYGAGDSVAILTATVSKGDEKSIVIFSLTVKESPQTDKQAVEEDANNLEITYAGNDNSRSVTTNVILPAIGPNGTTVTWTSGNNSVIAPDGTVFRPFFGSGDIIVLLTATVAKGEVTDIVEFSLIVKQIPPTDDEAVQEDTDNLEIIYADRDNALSVTRDISLSTRGPNDTNVTWYSSNNSVIAPDGTVINTVEATVVLTATVTRGEAVAEKSFTLNVVYLKTWGTKEIISNSDILPVNLQLAFDINDCATIVWEDRHDDESFPSLYANRYMEGSGWGPAEAVEYSDMKPDNPQIVFSETGEGFISWCANGRINYTRTDSYSPESGWDSAELICTNSGGATEHQIAMDCNGNAIAVWRVFNQIWINHFSPDTGWGTPDTIYDTLSFLYSPQIAFDKNGSAIVVWIHNDYITNTIDILCKRYTPGSGWSAAEIIENCGTSNAGPLRVAFDNNSNALVVWAKLNGYTIDIYASRYSVNNGWSSAEQVSNCEDFNGGSNPQVSFDTEGNAIAIWEQSYADKTAIWANYYTRVSGWGCPEIIETLDGKSINPRVVFDSEGNATAIWKKTIKQTHYIYSNQYLNGFGWKAAGPVETGTGNVGNPIIASDSEGNIIAAWGQNEYDTSYIYTSRLK